MNFKKLLILGVILFLGRVSSLYATPRNVEVWFISIDRTSFIDSLIPKTKFSPLVSQSRICQKMGEYCFDPQIGLYKEDSSGEVVEASDYRELDSKEKYDRLGSYKDSDFKTCENNGNFDIFCGKTKGSKANVKVRAEFWIDTSSSMKQVDYSGPNSTCARQYFLKTVGDKCPLNQKMKAYVFDENKREMGTYTQLCINIGLNRSDRIIRDIKNSKVENLVIITDIFEASSEFVDFIEGLPGGSTRGVDKPMYAKDIKGLVSHAQGLCQ